MPMLYSSPLPASIAYFKLPLTYIDTQCFAAAWILPLPAKSTEEKANLLGAGQGASI
jgi:hypothetical protein